MLNKHIYVAVSVLAVSTIAGTSFLYYHIDCADEDWYRWPYYMLQKFMQFMGWITVTLLLVEKSITDKKVRIFLPVFIGLAPFLLMRLYWQEREFQNEVVANSVQMLTGLVLSFVTAVGSVIAWYLRRPLKRFVKAALNLLYWPFGAVSKVAVKLYYYFKRKP